ncbi:IS4 family transposase [Gloeobacter morelensis]|uniref:IS4 family transposase n=1 Tax=Gloeobacter morelensis MG652769 TaxID=2781736 RepID=A0ABY3PL22_9CYAN|nr:IS4 family transposase [Gloeobacter morelensis]UFP93145.1 IS4 family transposase [Gloeobacter morelensis MG652769]UFP93639.1 IS4 family transposase [Gloeobacter morelensis MG652769]UFP94341.1 IS4 family transposase [Gloeobacter morelensis MG652769]UFP95067.1 IS4 family transposase [Gloeobacter morelensis MG652769]UFP95686.1 IS4 family transposase [Gloeobacter morelensis MG652769]
MLPLFYQHLLKERLAYDQVIFLQLLVHTLQRQQHLCIQRLAEALPLTIKTDSRRKAIQRFLLLPKLNIWHLWLPLLALIIQRFADNPHRLILAIDRTNWYKYNLLMVALIWQKRAIPIYWRLLNHDGNSSLAERRSVLRPVFRFFCSKSIVVLGDREFGSVDFARWLQAENVAYCLRLKQSEWLRYSEEAPWRCLANIHLEPGQTLWYKGVTLVKKKRFGPVNIVGKLGFQPGSRKPYHEPWWLLTNLATPQEAIAWYRCRWGIEEMFRDCKSGGYNLEKLRVEPRRFKRLLLVLAVAMSVSVLRGQRLKAQGVEKYVSRVSERGRSIRRRSTFAAGLHSEVWLEGMASCQSLVEQLMDMRKKWRQRYREGQRAVMLLQSTS